MPLPDVDEEDSKLRCPCPFPACGGIYSVTKGELRHTEPPCEKWNALQPTVYLAEARKEQARKDAAARPRNA